MFTDAAREESAMEYLLRRGLEADRQDSRQIISALRDYLKRIGRALDAQNYELAREIYMEWEAE